MPTNKPLDTSNPQSIELAWVNGTELDVTSAIVQKYARVLDMTDSGRDIKPLATGLFEALDRYKALAANADGSENAYQSIIAEAERLMNAR